MKRLSIEINRDNIIDLSTILRQRFGQDLLAKVIAEDAKNFTADTIVIDGIRRMDDVKYLKEIPGFVLSSIDADPKVRFERLVKRNENVGDDKKTFEEFLADHERETEASIPPVMRIANVHIDNTGTLEELYAQVDKIVEDARK